MKQGFTPVRTFLLSCLLLTCIAPRLTAQGGSLEGTVVKKNGLFITLYVGGLQGEAPIVGTHSEMSKYFEEKLGSMTMNGWLGVAAVEFTRVGNETVELRIVKEKSEITVNDEKVDHFKIGKRMKVEWPAEPEEEKGKED